jgi:ABC-type iron transport system FetAB permease component
LRWVLAQVRAVFVLLLVAAVMEFVFAHRDQIQQYADAKIDHTVAKVRASGDSSRIRQSAENHEKEVNDVINK